MTDAVSLEHCKESSNLQMLEPSILPLVLAAPKQGTPLTIWSAQNRSALCAQLMQHGAILFRNFQLSGIQDFEQTIQTLAGDLMPYQDRATPRQPVRGQIYTSTDYPPSHRIFLHNENSFAHTWPQKIFFYCIQAPQQGGETPLADITKVFQAIRPETRARFLETGVMYVRNFGNGYGLPWQKAFGTSDRQTLESFCQNAGIELEWRGPDHLRTRQIRPAAVKHPKTGQMVWFNHAAVLHISTLPPKFQKAMLAEFSPENLPNSTYYGDGSPIEADVLNEIRTAYQQATVIFPWQAGDVLWLDNLRVAHGREPFIGPRKVVVGMAEPQTLASLEDASSPTFTFGIPAKYEDIMDPSLPVITNPAVPATLNYAAPRTPLESILVSIWQAAMNIEPIGIHDNFFELGGQSLEASDIITAIEDIFQIPLSLLALNQTPTIAEMTRSLYKNEADRIRIEQITQLANNISHLSAAETETLLTSQKVKSKKL